METRIFYYFYTNIQLQQWFIFFKYFFNFLFFLSLMQNNVSLKIVEQMNSLKRCLLLVYFLFSKTSLVFSFYTKKILVTKYLIYQAVPTTTTVPKHIWSNRNVAFSKKQIWMICTSTVFKSTVVIRDAFLLNILFETKNLLKFPSIHQILAKEWIFDKRSHYGYKITVQLRAY